MLTVSLNQAYDLCLDVLRAKLVPFLQSSPGLGKSALAARIAKAFGLYLIDVRLSQCDPSDLMGFPFLSKETGKAGYVPMDFFPTEDTPLPEGYKGWLVLLDEFNSAPLSVQAAAYKILLDRMVGQHKLHPKAVCMAAGNLSTDNAITSRLSTATQSRIITMVIEVNQPEWIEWAEMEGQIDHRVISFIRFRPDLLHKFDPNHSDHTFPCPRTWEFNSKIIAHFDDAIPHKKLPVIAGTVGEGTAREFLEFTHIYGNLPDKDDILKNPEGIPISDEPSILFALTGMVANYLDTNNAETLMKFIQRMPIEFQFITLGSKIKKNRELQQVAAIRQWTIAQAKDLL